MCGEGFDSLVMPIERQCQQDASPTPSFSFA
jgi:hypothetical protein